MFGIAHCTVVFMCRGRAMQAVLETFIETSMSTCAICEPYIDPDLCNHHLLCHKLGWRGFTLEVLFTDAFSPTCVRCRLYIQG